MVSAAFHVNNKEAKREMKVNFNNETLSFCSELKYLGVTLDRLLTYFLTPYVTLREADITRRAPVAACWLRLGCWSNNTACNHPSPGAFNRGVGLLHSCLVPQCSHPPYRPRHQRCLVNCDALGGSPMECGVGGQPHKTPYFHLRHRNPPPEQPSQEEPGSSLTASAPVSGVSAHALQIGYGLLCGP